MAPMPRVFSPYPPEAGPGSAFAGTNLGKKRSRRRKVRSKSPLLQQSDQNDGELAEKNPLPQQHQHQQFIGQDLLDWHDESAPTGNIVSSSKSSSRDKKAVSFENNNGDESSSAPLTIDTNINNNYNGTYKSRRALAVDTRFLATAQATITAERVVHDCNALVRSLISRGVAPCWMASTAGSSSASAAVSSSHKASAGNKKIKSLLRVQASQMGASSMEKYLDGRKSFAIASIDVEACNENNIGDGKAAATVHLAKELLALNSWKVLGTMVNTIVAEDDKAGSSAKLAPLDITILTNDVSLFCDPDDQSHTAGVDRFWKKVAPFFQDSKVGKIQIVMAKTGTVASMTNPSQKESKESQQDTANDDDIMDVSTEDAALIRNHESAVSKCIRAIITRLQMRSQADFKKNRSHIDAGETPVDISFSVIDNGAVGYQALSRQWVRDALLGQSLRGSLELELPETVDGTQCSVSLDVSYQVFPFAAYSNESKRLLVDLQLLSESKMEIIQLLPLDSIDASLLFGIPMLVRAELAQDFDHFEVMQVLTRSLFSFLAERECAMLLRRTGEMTTSGVESGIFHSTEQTFVLMAKELPKTVTGAPNSGLLYRYAHADQVLAEAIAPMSEVLLDVDTQQQYSNYVENALDCLESSPVNPLYDDSTTAYPSLPTTLERCFAALAPMCREVDQPAYQDRMRVESPESCGSVWDDTAGVGSRGLLPSPTKAEGLSPDGTEDTMEEDISAFDF